VSHLGDRKVSTLFGIGDIDFLVFISASANFSKQQQQEIILLKKQIT
jgi:hypothetical protein